MLSLADRHESRAKRLAANGTELNGTTSDSVGTVALAFRSALEMRARLGDEGKEQLDGVLKNIEQEADFGNRSLAEAPDGSGVTMAGIGVINTKHVPAGVFAAEAGNGGGTDAGSFTAEGNAGWGEIPPATVAGLPESPEINGNLGGMALAEQGAGSDTKKAETASKKKTPEA